MRRRCVYCGYPLDGGRKRTCGKHTDLPRLDPGWWRFLMWIQGHEVVR